MHSAMLISASDVQKHSQFVHPLAALFELFRSYLSPSCNYLPSIRTYSTICHPAAPFLFHSRHHFRHVWIHLAPTRFHLWLRRAPLQPCSCASAFHSELIRLHAPPFPRTHRNFSSRHAKVRSKIPARAMSPTGASWTRCALEGPMGPR